MLHLYSKQYKGKDNKNVSIVNGKLASLVTKLIVFFWLKISVCSFFFSIIVN